MKDIKVASVQFCSLPNDKQSNLDLIEKYCDSAAGQNVELIAFPEMCITGYWYLRNYSKDQILKLAESVKSGNSVNQLKQLSKKYNLTISAGLVEVSDEGKIYNTYVAVTPHQEVHVHRKLHCFINPHFSSGEEYKVFQLPSGQKVGILICYDNNLIENVRITALMGADIILAPHQTGGCHSQDENIMGTVSRKLWEERLEHPNKIEAEFKGDKGRGWLLRWLPSRAHDNGVFYIFSNGVGPDDNEVRTGNAMIIDPYGRILSETWKAGDDMVTADLLGGSGRTTRARDGSRQGGRIYIIHWRKKPGRKWISVRLGFQVRGVNKISSLYFVGYV